jgi:hypothetical protein
MEHGLILIIEAILALDRRLQKPLREVVTELSRLKAEPRDVLEESPIIVGPRKAYAVSTVLGLIVSIVVLLLFLMAALDQPNPAPGPEYFIVGGICVLLTGIASATLLLHWLRGGSAILRPQGVEFIYRGRTLFCPWSLFQTTGNLYQPDHKRVILPANDKVPVASSDADGNVTARPAAEVKWKPLTACAAGQVALADLYEARLGEFADLLLHLGRHLGVGGPDTADNGEPATPRPPLVTAEDDGWLRVRLTRLPFPPVCAGCGEVTGEKIQCTLDSTHAIHINVPLCPPCQAVRQVRRRHAVLIGLGAGLLPAVIWALIASVFFDVLDLCVGVGFLVPLGLLGGLIGGLVARDRADPARFRDYSSTAGTVAMHVRPSTGGEAFRQALGAVH